MAIADIANRPYAKLDALKPGDRIEADDGFDCMDVGEVKVVMEDKDGLYIECTDEDGKHYLDGQDDGDGYLVGLYKV